MPAKFLESVVIDDQKIGAFGREIQMDLEAKKTLVEDVGTRLKWIKEIWKNTKKRK